MSHICEGWAHETTWGHLYVHGDLNKILTKPALYTAFRI